MAVAKRCLICHRKLREDGYCENPKCPDYIRTQIHDEEQKKEKKEEE